MLDACAPLNVWIYARDLARSRRFYEETLGFPLWREEPGTALHFGVGGSVLSIRRTADGNPVPHGVFVVLPLGREIDRICADLLARGVALEAPLADREFGRSAMLRDPDGYEIWIVRPSATETQVLRWRLRDRSRARRIPVNRKVAPRPHTRPLRTRRARHPES